MKQYFLAAALAAFITMTAGIILRSGAAAVIGWALTTVFVFCYLECCDRDRKRRAERRAEELRRKHANDLDTQRFSTALTREQLMRDYEKIKL